MIDKKLLLDGCKRLMKSLEDDLIARSVSMPEVRAQLQQDYEEARKHKRTAQNFEDWRSDYATQQAAAWVLSAVFVRFLEDNGLVSPPRLAGPGEALTRARDQHELYFREHPTETDREYLLHVFRTVAALPGGREIFGPHNPVFELPQWLSGDAAGAILQALQRIDANSGALVHDFSDPEWDTRFLGDLYQDLSEAARKKYALLQTPEFVEEFILDRTLDPALDEFGLEAPPVKSGDGDPITAPGFRMIDPACGSGHFLLGAFRRILDRWQRRDPGANPRELVQRALNSVHGVDINPFAIAIARFRLLIQALQACGVAQLKDAPAFHFHLAAGDSLLHGAPTALYDLTIHDDDLRVGRVGKVVQQHFGFDPLIHHYQSEDIDALRKILRPRTFHAVVANPPYIVPNDKVLNQAYREHYSACHRQYALTVPFMERIFGLAVQSGYTGQITSNSFMKREFGKKLIEEFFPKVDLTHVIDTSGAYLPGHGTPTVILFGRNRAPIGSLLRTVLGIQGGPPAPKDPPNGLVWRAIIGQIDQPGSESKYVSSGDSARILFHTHPWSIGGGGATELKERIDSAVETQLGICTTAIGRGMHTACDESYFAPSGTWRRYNIDSSITLVEGDIVRDWLIQAATECIFPYDKNLVPIEDSLSNPLLRTLWLTKQFLVRRREPNGTHEEIGLTWFEWSRFQRERFRNPLSIVFAEVSTHNHFVLDRGGKVFKQTAPVIKLAEGTTEDEHLSMLGALTSSVGCFWMKQVCHCKGSTVDQHGARQTTVPFEDFYQHNGTALKEFPLPAERPVALARAIDNAAQGSSACRPGAMLAAWNGARDLGAALFSARDQWVYLQATMIALQEELDWQSYRLYGLVSEDLTMPKPPPLDLGERAFEIVLARKLAAGEEDTTWFTRHGSTPITEIPAHWPEDYRTLVQRRIDLIESNKDIGLIERPEYKRRWNTESWDSQQARALRGWLLDRLESYFDFDGRMNESGTATARVELGLCSVARLADVARSDSAFEAAAALYTGNPAFDAARLVTDLVLEESVPHLPVLRYKPAGLRKREEWEKTWALQRQEDLFDACAALPEDHPNHLSQDEAKKRKKQAIGDIPVPPKYGSGDFLKTGYWKLRGKLDVPKERWVSFPHGEGQDGTLLVAWAGYDHLQLARALSAHYVDIQERLGGRDDPRLTPLLASLAELIPWLKQWHNDLDPEFNMAMGDYFEGFVMEEARRLEMTVEEVRGWEPVKKGKHDKRKTVTK